MPRATGDRVAAVTPCFRPVDSRSAPRSSSRATLVLRLADQRHLPPWPDSGPVQHALRAPCAGPESEDFVLDILILLIANQCPWKLWGGGGIAPSLSANSVPLWGNSRAPKPQRRQPNPAPGLIHLAGAPTPSARSRRTRDSPAAGCFPPSGNRRAPSDPAETSPGAGRCRSRSAPPVPSR